jgi:hypothetical protein
MKTQQEIVDEKLDPKIVDEINELSYLEMAKLWRFAPVGHSYFDMRKPYWNVFKKRFQELGGMTSIISKQIGWEKK